MGHTIHHFFLMHNLPPENTPVLLLRETQMLRRTLMSKVVIFERAELHCMSCKENTDVENTFYLPMSHSRGGLTWQYFQATCKQMEEI